MKQFIDINILLLSKIEKKIGIFIYWSIKNFEILIIDQPTAGLNIYLAQIVTDQFKKIICSIGYSKKKLLKNFDRVFTLNSRTTNVTSSNILQHLQNNLNKEFKE